MSDCKEKERRGDCGEAEMAGTASDDATLRNLKVIQQCGTLEPTNERRNEGERKRESALGEEICDDATNGRKARGGGSNVIDACN